MEERMLRYIQQREYLKPEDNISRIAGRPAQLIWGRHWETPPFVTIAIPAYRRQALLKKALESALGQVGFEEYQILIVDDSPVQEGESSETEAMIREYADDRILYYRNPENLGLMDNWNMCYYLSRSPWVCTLHDDDSLPQNFLAKMCAVVKKYPQMDALFNLAHQFDGAQCTPQMQKELTRPVAERKVQIRAQKFWRQNFGFAAGRITGSFIRREAFVGAGGFGVDHFPGGRDILYNDDYCLAVRLFANYRCYILPQNIYNYRTGDNNGSARVKDYLPDIVQEYYLGRKISETKCILWRWIFFKRNKYQTVRNARRLDALVRSGSERMNREARVDFQELQRACGWKTLECSPLGMRLTDAFWKGYSLCRRALETVYSHTIIC